MELVDVNELRPGDVVAAPVGNPSGGMLCPMGFELTDAAIERLRNAGVEAVVVEGSGAGGPSKEERTVALDARFAGVEDPVLLQLKAMLQRHIDATRA